MTKTSTLEPLTEAELKGVAWRKSTRSNNNGPSCVEAGSWRKSTRSNSGADQNCVEAGTCHCHGVAIRDSKLPTTGNFPTLSVTRTEWDALLDTVKAAALTPAQGTRRSLNL